MMMHKLTEVYAIIPVAMLLTVSYFVLLTARKVDTKGLKIFGQFIAALLWVAATLVLITGISLSSCKRHKMKMPMERGMMHGGQEMPMPHELMPMQK